MKPRILIAESSGMSSEAIAMLSRVGDVVAADLDRPGLIAAVRDATVLWVRLRHRIDEEVLAAARGLRIVASPTTGLDHLDLVALERRGVETISLRGAEFLKDVRATAELTLALMLAVLRNLPAALADAKSGNWNRDAFKGREIHGKTVGIVGYGRLGRIVTGYVRAFGANVIATDPEAGELDGTARVSLDELLEQSDIVTLHVSLSDQTRHLIGADQLARMRVGAILVNTSRGEIVDEAALLDALRTRHLAGAALDVLAGESRAGVSGSALLAYAQRHDEVLITPHIGGCTYESMEKTELYLAGRVCDAVATLERTP